MRYSTLIDSSDGLNIIDEDELEAQEEEGRAISVEELQQESQGIQALLLEIIRRAAYDWVLYRSHHRLKTRKLAQEAHTWLFEEKQGHPDWNERARNDKMITSFLSICELLELDPDAVRDHIRGITVKQILSTGRPPIYRKKVKEQTQDLYVSGTALLQEIQSWQDEVGFCSGGIPAPQEEVEEPARTPVWEQPVQVPTIVVEEQGQEQELIAERVVMMLKQLVPAYPQYWIDPNQILADVVADQPTLLIERMPLRQPVVEQITHLVSFIHLQNSSIDTTFLEWLVALPQTSNSF